MPQWIYNMKVSVSKILWLFWEQICKQHSKEKNNNSNNNERDKTEVFSLWRADFSTQWHRGQAHEYNLRARQCGLNFNNTLIFLLYTSYKIAKQVCNFHTSADNVLRTHTQLESCCCCCTREWDKDRQTKEKLMQNYSWDSLSRIAMIFGRCIIFWFNFWDCWGERWREAGDKSSSYLTYGACHLKPFYVVEFGIKQKKDILKFPFTKKKDLSSVLTFHVCKKKTFAKNHPNTQTHRETGGERFLCVSFFTLGCKNR